MPVAVYLFVLALIRDRCCLSGWGLAILPGSGLLVLVTPRLAENALAPMAALLVLTTWLRRSPAVPAVDRAPA